MRTFIMAAALAVAASTAFAEPRVPSDAAAFAKKAANANAFEIQASELARERAQSSEVRSFAERMIADHTKMGQDLEAALQAGHIPAPPSDKLSVKQKAQLAKLRSKQGPAFDKAYATRQVADHKKAVSLFRKYARKGRSAPLKEFAQRTLPVLEQHLSLAKELSTAGIAVGERGRTGTGSRAIGPPAQMAPRERAR